MRTKTKVILVLNIFAICLGAFFLIFSHAYCSRTGLELSPETLKAKKKKGIHFLKAEKELNRLLS